MATAAAADSARRRPRRGLKASDSGFSQTLTACTRSGDAAAAMAAFDSAAAAAGGGGGGDGSRFLAAHQYNQLLHLLSTSPSSPSAAAAARRVFSHMLAGGAAPSEATITSMARVAAAGEPGGGDEAFELVRSMKEKYGLVPRLRTYGPVLAAFRRGGEAEKAYAVEAHMVASGVAPEEPELAALLEVSAGAGDAGKVYEYMHKLRRAVDCVSEATAEVLESWFGSAAAAGAGAGQACPDECSVKDAILANGGGCHGLGWLGTGPWSVRRVNAASDGECGGCRCRLACVDIARDEMQRFADRVAGLAFEREVKTNFSNFQGWLETHNRYEAIIDGANIALYQQNFAEGGFSLSQLDAVVRELRGRNKGEWPLIVLHKKRFTKLMENPANRQLLETWRAEGALYTSPSGSNDDWYWLYAAIRLNCLLVTNDEMRDHIFELLGKSFFPKWKQRHQVKYSFNKGKLELVMPPPYSSEIQESGMGSWHVPMDEKSGDERLRTWLCISRTGPSKGPREAAAPVQKSPPPEGSDGAHLEPSEEEAGHANGKRKHRDRPFRNTY